MIEYPKDVARELSARLEKDARGDKGRPPLVPPTFAQLEAVLDTAWAATTLDEEGRRTIFTLMLVERAELANAYEPLIFSTPRPFTAAAIAKLAPATDPRETVILVGTGDDGVLVIWGLLFLGDTSFAVDQRMRPVYLVVHGFRPGSLFVRWKTRALVRYAGGVAYWYDNDDETITSLLRASAATAAMNLKIPTGAAISHTLQEVATRMVNAGHGGTLLVYERLLGGKRDGGPARVEFPPQGTFVTPDTTLRDAMVAYEQLVSTPTDPKADRAKVVNDRHRCERRYRDAIDHVARLANVDGAVLMHTDLSVVGFGVTIDVDKSAAFTLAHFDPKTRATRPKSVAELSGHRHKSAAHFCASQVPKPGPASPVIVVVAFAIVASQDGKLSLFTVGPDSTCDVVEISPLILNDAA